MTTASESYQLLETPEGKLYLLWRDSEGKVNMGFGPFYGPGWLQHDLRQLLQTHSSTCFRTEQARELPTNGTVIADETAVYLDRMASAGREFFCLDGPVTDVLGADGQYWPPPLESAPKRELVEWWLAFDTGGCEATDGCWVDRQGVCPHGYPSWARFWGIKG